MCVLAEIGGYLLNCFVVFELRYIHDQENEFIGQSQLLFNIKKNSGEVSRCYFAHNNKGNNENKVQPMLEDGKFCG